MTIDDELATFDLETVEGLERILAAIVEIRPQFESRETWDLANRRLENLARVAGCPLPLVAATVFREIEHPRGPDGRFIETFSWVRWFDFPSQRWFRGKVMDVGDDGEVTVHRRLDADNVGVYRFSFDQSSKQLYSSPKPKATLALPEVMEAGDNNGWRHLGESGGFNPGGTYELDHNDGVQYHKWTDEELEFLLHGRPSVEVIGLVDEKDQFDDENFSDRLKERLQEAYPVGDEVGIWEDIPGGRRSMGGVIVWDDPDEGPQLAVVNRDNEHEQRPTPEGKWRADFALQDWALRRLKAKILPQNPERKLHPSWRRVLYGIGPDTGLGINEPSLDIGIPRLPRLPDLSTETAQGIAQSASQAVETAAEIRNAATGALVQLEQVIQADPTARFFPFEVDADVLGNGDRLRALINSFVEPAIRPGDKFYVKDLSFNHTGPDWVANEVTAVRLYELAGVAVPDVYQGNDPSKIGSRIIGGRLTDVREHLGNPEVMARVRAGFTVDAWLANWDVAGNTFDNIVVDEDGIPYRIDAGGALAYGGAGDRKGNMFGSEVGELVTLGPDSPYGETSNAPTMFEGLTQEEMVDGARRIAGISPQQIRDLALETNIEQNTTDTLIARRTYIIDHLLGGVDPFAGEQGEEFIPEVVTEEVALDQLTGEPKADLDVLEMLKAQPAPEDVFDNPAFREPTPVEPEPPIPGQPQGPVTQAAESVQPENFPPALSWNDAWSWSGESQQWVTSDEAHGPPTADELEGRWLDRVEELTGYITQIENDGVVSRQMPAADLVGSGALDNPKGIVLMTDNLLTRGGRTDMFVPWGTDADGDQALISRISGQIVTPAKDWSDVRATVRTVDLTAVADDLDEELDWIDGLATKAADAQVALEAGRTTIPELAASRHLSWLTLQDVGEDPADLYILGGRTPVTVAKSADGGLQLLDARTGESMFFVSPDLVQGFGEPTDPFVSMIVERPDGSMPDLVLPDMTGQQIMRAQLSRELLLERSSLADAAEVTAGFPPETWVKPDPEINQPDVSTVIRSSKPIPVGRLAGPALGDDWDYVTELPAGSYIDTSQPTQVDPNAPAHPGLPNSVPIIESINFEAATDELDGQWVMHDVQDYRFTRQPVHVDEVLRGDDGIEGIAVTYPDGSQGILQGPGRSRLHVVEPPKEGRNIPALESEIVLAHNGDIRIGSEVVGSWWHTDRNISHRHTYGYMVEGDYTAHGKAAIGFRTHARDVRKQVRSEVWYADNYEDIKPESIPKEPGAKILEQGVKTTPAPGRLRGGQGWEPGQAVNLNRAWSKSDAQGVIVGGVHPDRPDLVYYRDHYTGHITLEDAGELTAHGDDPEDAKTGGLFNLEGDTWYIQQVIGNEVVAYSVTQGHEEVFELNELPAINEPSPWVPISSYEGAYLAGSLSSQEAKDEWQAVGGQLLADGEVPLPGAQVVDRAGTGWRVLRSKGDDLVLMSGPKVQEMPAHQFRVDRAHYGGAVGGIGRLEIRALDGHQLEDYEPALGDVVYVAPGEFRILRGNGEVELFSADDGHRAPGFLYATEHGELIQKLFGPDAHRVGVFLGGDTSVFLSHDTEGTVLSSQVVGSMDEARAGISGANKAARVMSFTDQGIDLVYEPPAAGTDQVELPSGAAFAGSYEPVLRVDIEDLEWFDPPEGLRGPGREAGQVPVITAGDLPPGTWDGKTFPTAENAKALAEAIELAWAGASFDEGSGKTVHLVQFDQGAIEDFAVQIMPVRDVNTGQEYTELFFRPLEDHAGELYNSLTAPAPDETLGHWDVDVDNPVDLSPDELELGDIIAVRRGPNGVLVGWGYEGEFGTARVISPARVVGQEEGVNTYEFDVQLPNGKAATVIQANRWHTYQKAEWVVETPEGDKVRPLRPGELRPIKLAEEARSAGWRMGRPGLGSQVKHETENLRSDGVKVIDTEATFDGEDYGEKVGTGGTFLRKLGDDTKLWVSLARPRRLENEQNNFARQVFIQIPRDDSRGPDEMARSISGAMEAVGISLDQQQLPTPEALEAWALNTIGQSFGASPEFRAQLDAKTLPSVGPLQPGKKWDRAAIELLLAEEVSPRVGRDVTLADFEFVVDPDGRLQVVTTEQLARDISAQSGYTSLRHESDLIWTDPAEGAPRLGAQIARALGAGKAGDNIGPAGRAALGNWKGGQSSDTDIHEGSGNRFYFWTHASDPPEVRTQGGYDIVIDDEVFQRFLGNGMSSRDNNGSRTQSQGGNPLQSWTSQPGFKTEHNEATMKYGLDGDLIEAITVPDEVYEGVLETVRGYGLEQVNGRPIEDIIQPASRSVSMLERRRRRQARPNSGFFPVVANLAQVLAGPAAAPTPGIPELPAPADGLELQAPGAGPTEAVVV